MIGLENEEAVVSIEAIFKSGKRINGNKDTTGIGIASLTHKKMISAPTASTLFALASTRKGFTKKIKSEMIRLIYIPI